MNTSPWKRGLKLLGTAASLARQEAVSAISGSLQGKDSGQNLLVRVRQAKELVNQLASLKGAAMKLGQIMALEARDYFPDEVVEILEQLQSSAEPMKRESVEAILAEELGDRRKRLESFDYNPIAAASIGQVHQAYVEGQKVAVKVQYPKMNEALDSDLALLKKLVQLFSLLSGKNSIDSSSLVEEVSAVFKQETNYRAEAQFLKEYRENAATLEGLWVPRAFEELSSEKVLTMEFAEGITLSEAIRLEKLDRDKREYYADLFMTLYAHEFCNWGLVQTDPNLGNFLLDLPRSRLIPLDFGATKKYSMDFRKQYCQMVLAAYSQDRAALSMLMDQLGFLNPKETNETRQALTDLIVESMGPFRSRIHDFQDDTYPQRMRQLTRKLIQSLEYSPPPRDLIFLHRKLGGIFQILRRLESKRSLKPYLDIYERMAHP